MACLFSNDSTWQIEDIGDQMKNFKLILVIFNNSCGHFWKLWKKLSRFETFCWWFNTITLSRIYTITGKFPLILTGTFVRSDCQTMMAHDFLN